jgi:hypothetical protein
MNASAIPAANREVTAKDNNPPDYAKIETARLVDEYKGLTNTLIRLDNEAGAIPDKIEDDETALRAGGIIKSLRDLRARLEDTRKVEVEPDLRRMNAKNAYFNGHQETIQPENKRERLNNPGIIDVTQAKINGHQDRKEAAERARLAEEAAERKRIADEAEAKAKREREAAEALKKEADDKAAAALRARTAETQAARQQEADEAAKAASAAAATAKSAEVVAETAKETHQDARIATLATASSVVRTQGVTESGAGVTLTKATEKYAYVTDRTAMTDEVKLILFGHFTDAELDKAVRSFANNTRYGTPLAGCEIGTRKKGVTR